MELKTVIIVSAIACVLCSISSIGLTYKYTSQHYELQIKDEHLKQQTELAKANEKVIVAERKNNEITSNLNAQALANSKIVDGLRAGLRNYRVANKLRVSADSCISATTVADSASNSVVAGASTATGGVCQLSGQFSEFLEKVTYDADVMRNNLIICKQYAETIDEQRKRMHNDNKE